MKKQELINKLIRDRDYYMDAESHKRKTLDGFIKLVKQLEPEITEEQAWNKIAETVPLSLPELKGIMSRYAFSGSYNHEPELPVIPQFVADFLSDKSIYSLEERIKYLIGAHDGDSYYFCEIFPEQGHVTQEEGDRLYDYAQNEKLRDLLLLINGYTIEPEPRWVLKLGNMYFKSGHEGPDNDFVIDATDKKSNAYIFTDKSEANSLEKDTGGTLEDIPEDEAMKLIEGWKE